MLGGYPPAAEVVREDGRLVAVHRLRHRVDHGNAKAHPDARPRLDSPAGHDEAVHLAAERHLQVPALAIWLVPGVAHEHRDLADAERVLGAEHDRDAEPAEAVGGDHADRVGAPGQQAPGQHVGREA